MGRGRAKAKQTKVARQLKYGGPHTDLDRLQAELAADRGESLPGLEPDGDEDEDDDFADMDDMDRLDLDEVGERGSRAAGR